MKDKDENTDAKVKCRGQGHDGKWHIGKYMMWQNDKDPIIHCILDESGRKNSIILNTLEMINER